MEAKEKCSCRLMIVDWIPHDMAISRPMQIDEHISYRGIIVFILLGLGFMVMGFLSKKQADELSAGNQTIEARVTESKVTEKKGKKSHQIKYAFKPGNEGADVTRCDFLGRKDLWSTLSEEEYTTATASGKVQVRYATANPSNNEPASAGARSSKEILGALGAGGVSLLIGLIGLIRKKRAERAGA
ncbi:DUF3592 domain-containing protein [Prosthecobacter sp.]|uniref:DUF3592 domain-containing protein n=1 Tax=Prosthecobacter sp. TaxID=1965333 RepID=UPI001D1B565D|nr:DUF3592 domain-containing protein [Prosthecobacter sp.]MCB1276793.1 DUF3592 domain-containing protein [Prosthecobacter sp.]